MGPSVGLGRAECLGVWRCTLVPWTHVLQHNAIETLQPVASKVLPRCTRCTAVCGACTLHDGAVAARQPGHRRRCHGPQPQRPARPVNRVKTARGDQSVRPLSPDHAQRYSHKDIHSTDRYLLLPTCADVEVPYRSLHISQECLRAHPGWSKHHA